MQVPTRDYSGYVRNLVKELYGPLRAAVKGDLTGPGTLGTVMLCESILSFLPSGSYLNQPYQMLKSYDIVPLSTLHFTRKIDLRRFATTRNSILYIRKPTLQRLYIPTPSLPFSARATVKSMLSFLEHLKAGVRSPLAISRAAKIIVDQFKRDLHEMGIVCDPYLFQDVFRGTSSVCIRDALTADEYISRVLVHPEQLPSEMSARGFLTIALDLFEPSQLKQRMVEALLTGAKIVPHTTVHARRVIFSSSLCTVIVRGPVSGIAVSPDDAHRLVLAATQLLKDCFVARNQLLKECQKNRPRLIQCVTEAISRARSRTKGKLRHILAVVACATMVLADRESILPRKPNFTKLIRRTNLNRYTSISELKDIVRMTDVEAVPEEGRRGRTQIALRSLPNCHLRMNRVVTPRRH